MLIEQIDGLNIESLERSLGDLPDVLWIRCKYATQGIIFFFESSTRKLARYQAAAFLACS
jgi:hypothetical protein